MECFACGRTEDVDYPFGSDCQWWVCDCCEYLFGRAYNSEMSLGATEDEAAEFAAYVVKHEGWA